MNTPTLSPLWTALARDIDASLATRRARRHAARWAERFADLDAPLAELVDRANHNDDAHAVTRALIELHRDRDPIATAVLMRSRLTMLARVARHCHVDGGEFCDRRTDQQQATVAAWLDVLTTVSIDNPHLVHNLYWDTLRRVTHTRPTVPTIAIGDIEAEHDAADDIDVAGTVVDAHAVEAVIDVLTTAHPHPHNFSTTDRAVLVAMYQRDEAISVRALAAEIGMSENALESRLRRATSRLRAAAHPALPQTRAAAA